MHTRLSVHRCVGGAEDAQRGQRATSRPAPWALSTFVLSLTHGLKCAKLALLASQHPVTSSTTDYNQLILYESWGTNSGSRAHP